MGTTRYPAAEIEVAWFFGAAAAALGLQAQACDGSGGAAVWDAARIDRLHTRMLGERQGEDAERYARCRATLVGLTSAHRIVLETAYTSRPWDAALRAAADTVGQHGTLAGVIVVSASARGAFASAHDGRSPTGPDELARWLGERARQGRRDTLFAPLNAAARALLEDALGAYDAARRTRVAAERQERQARLARIRAGVGT